MVDFNANSKNAGQVQWSRQLAEQLDAADGKKDGKINASVWNSFLDKMGSNGNRINNFISTDNAQKSFNFYDKKKDAGSVDWQNSWESAYAGMFEHSVDIEQPVPHENATPQAVSEPEAAPAQEQAAVIAARMKPEEEPVNVETEVRTGSETGAKIEIQSSYFADGSIQRIAFVNGEQMDYFYDGQLPLLGEVQYHVKNSPFKIINGQFPTEADLVKAGFEKDNSVMTQNGGVIYKNPATGEFSIYTPSDRTVEYQNGGVVQRQCYDENGKLVSGSVIIKRAPGDFATYEYENDLVTAYGYHEPITTPDGLAEEAVIGHTEHIGAFMEENLGLSYNVAREFASVVTGDGEMSGERLSENGNYKLKIIVEPDGSQTRIHYKKQTDGTFKELGTIKLIKYEALNSLRGYDFKFEGYNNQTGASRIISGASWDFN